MRADPWMAATIIRRERLTSSCHIIRIRPQGALTNLVAGQTVNLSLQPPLGVRRVSSFTVLSTHSHGEISLLIRSTGTGGVSDGLISTLEPSDTMWMGDSIPTMTLPPVVADSEILCLVAGSGISILGGLAENHTLSNADIVFVGREEDCAAIPQALTQHLVSEIPSNTPRSWTTWNSTSQGRPTEADITRLIGSQDHYAAVVVCGPDGFCRLVKETCSNMGIDDERLAVESFGTGSVPKGASTTSLVATAVIDLFGQTHAVSWPENENLLSAMLSAGLEAPYSCRAGICSTCQCSVLIGDAEMEVDLGLSDEEKAAGLTLACQLRPVSGALAVRFDSATNA